MRLLAVTALVLAAAALLGSQALAAPHDANPVVKLKAPKFGAILATKGHLALYTWNKEKGMKVQVHRRVREDVAAARRSRTGRWRPSTSPA